MRMRYARPPFGWSQHVTHVPCACAVGQCDLTTCAAAGTDDNPGRPQIEVRACAGRQLRGLLPSRLTPRLGPWQEWVAGGCQGGDEEEGREVREYGEFVRYLAQKHPDAKIAYLPFQGRNRVVYRT